MLLLPHQAVAQLLHVCCVSGDLPGQDASMDSGMQGLHPASQHLRMFSQLRNIPATQQTHRQVREATQVVTKSATLFHFHSKDQDCAPTSRPIRRRAGFQLCPLRPPEPDPHPPAFWRRSPGQFYLTRSKVLRGKTDSRLTKPHCCSVFDRKRK